MKEILRTWQREYGIIFTDGGLILIFFAAILVYPLFTTVPYSPEILREIPVAVVDQDHSRLSRQLVRMTDATESMRVTSTPLNLAEARRQLLAKETCGIIVVPHDFQRSILRNKRATVAVFSDATYFLIYRQILTGMVGIGQSLSATIEIERMGMAGLPYLRAQSAREPLSLKSIPLFNPSGGYASYLMPAVLMVLLQQTLLIGIGMLRGTASEMPRQTMPRRGNVIGTVLGRTGAYMSIYVVHAVYFFLILFRFYRYPQHADVMTLGMILLPFLLAAVFLGQAVAELFLRRELSLLAVAPLSILALFIAGFSWPAESIPSWLRTLSFLLPSTSGIDGFFRVNLMGADLRDIAGNLGILWGLAAGYFALACLSLRYGIKRRS